MAKKPVAMFKPEDLAKLSDDELEVIAKELSRQADVARTAMGLPLLADIEPV